VTVKDVFCESRKDLNQSKKELAKLTHNHINGNLEAAIKGADVFIGVSVRDILTPKMVKKV